MQRFALPYPTLNTEGDYPRFAVYGDYYLLTANGWRYDANDDDKVTYDGTVVYVINNNNRHYHFTLRFVELINARIYFPNMCAN